MSDAHPHGTPTQPVIARASPTDRDGVVALFAEDLDYLRLSYDRAELGDVFDRMLADPNAVVFVAHVPQTAGPVGVLVATRMLSVRFAGRALWIEVLFVTRRGRKQGLGRALVEELMDLAREQGYRGIDLEAYHGNAPAGLLYRSLGFRRLGRERFNYHFDWEDEVDP